MNPKPLALIFSTVWPEPDSSAAGVRQLQWSRFLRGLGYEVVFSSPSKVKEELIFEERTLSLPLNRSEVKDELKRLNPSLVLFDRFILEEQFGHFVYECCPDALVLLETQDLHFVRRAREPVRERFLSDELLPAQFYQTETALRETASLLRVDYSFLVSSFEEKLLKDEFQIGAEKVKWLPFFYETPVIDASFEIPFSEREGFSWIGNFRHAPNVDGLRWFRSEIWPLIRKKIPGVKIHVYGAYPSAEVMSWNQPAQGFLVHGPAKSLDSVFLKARVNLAPLRFGAGVKGKILEGFRYGLPIVTTPVGEEGLLPQEGSFLFPGKVESLPEAFAKAACDLYENEADWKTIREASKQLMQTLYSEKNVIPELKNKIEFLMSQKRSGALPDWHSKILRHESVNSHQYFSKWIEEKEKKNAASVE